MKKLPLDIQYFSSGPEASVTKECIYNEQGICSSVKVTISSNMNILKILDSNETDVTTEWGLTSGSTENGSTATKTFTSNQDIALSVEIGTNDRGAGYIDVNIDITEIASEQETAYVYCKSKCKHPLVMQNKTLVDNNHNIKVEVFRIGNICHLVGYSYLYSVTINTFYHFDLPTWAKPSKTLESTNDEGSRGYCFLRASNTIAGKASAFNIEPSSGNGQHYNCLTYYVE